MAGHYSQVLTQLGQLCHTRNFHLKELGRLKNKEQFPFVSVTINDNVELPTIVYSAGIHGNEIAPVYAIIEFLKRFEPEKFKQFRIILFPVACPSGFEVNRRKNYEGFDLNSCFQKEEQNLPIECYLMMKEINGIKKLLFFGAFHEDLYPQKGNGKFYLFNFERKPEKIYRDLVIVASGFIPSAKGLFDTGEGIARDGLITNSFDKSLESRVFLERGCISACFETPAPKNSSLRTRIFCNVALMSAIPNLLASELKC